ncbi:baseplate J/gp47 family protein [Parachryseolinea silvisoli]|uniref:baseplate J/gp47 family protein n=1 Tax=Parachryseolinea silvisoli TaxID=2873601 RepID=UPI002265D226|nr:baseplate J/gp47 family protein [Parachryseolinea silvisoli]MCD9019681.1 baseplate J/gp47 family protein [Parachryseolinea silvisoli]
MRAPDENVDIPWEDVHDPYGSSRNRRFAAALHPEYFKIDERTLADFLVFAEQYAAYVYADAPDVSGDATTWQNFFGGSIIVFLARLCSGKPVRTVTYDILSGAATPPHHVLHKLNNFVRYAGSLPGALPPSLEKQTNSKKISHLLFQLDELKAAMDRVIQSCRQAGIVIDYATKDTSAPAEGDDATQQHTTAVDASLDMFLSLSHKVTESAQNLLHEFIYDYQEHDPALALYVSFLKLYAYAQEDLNKITGKHLDYFFYDLLQQKHKPSEPDEVYVCVRLSDHVETAAIERGTLFNANLDEEGLDCLYAAKDYASVNQTQVVALGSFYPARKGEIGIEPYYEFISAIYETDLLYSAGGFDFTAAARAFPAFGEAVYNATKKTMKPSEIGFAIASPTLLLREGCRQITLSLQFELNSMSPLVSFFERYAKAENLSANNVFYRIFSEAFSISLTTPGGWHEVSDYTILPPAWGSGKVEFYFELPLGAPPITPFGEDWPADEVKKYNTLWPVMKISLADRKTMYTYSYLEHLIIQTCSIAVEVSQIKNLEVYNDLGKVETSVPFYPFGALPVMGSAFLVGYDELTKKQISDIALEITWHNLPRVEGGFREHYETYGEDITNDSFRVGVTGLSDYAFHPVAADKIQTFPLFVTQQNDGQTTQRKPAIQTTIQDLDVKALKLHDNFTKEPLGPYDNSAKTGYIKIELITPEMGFGHQKYPILLSEAVLRKARREDTKLPEAPYTPQVKSLALRYRASTQISFQKSSALKAHPKADEKTFQLQAFGVRTTFAETTPSVDTLLPQYEHDGYLLLGLDTVLPGEAVTFCFVLERNTLSDSTDEVPTIEWYYVSDDTWHTFNKKDVIFDTTRSFTTTGLVKLVTPADISNQNAVLPGGCYWIIAALKGDPTATGKIRSIQTQAITLTWTPHKPGAQWKANLPPNTINSLALATSDIVAVFQPAASFGGRPKEAPQDFYIRVSEFLAHKNRAVTAWDIERLVLENLPAVNQVKCISAVEYPFFTEVGKVIVVVTPKVMTGDRFILPRFSPAVLQDIRIYLEKRISAFATIVVVNPTYEEVKITADIVLADEVTGEYEDVLYRDIRNYLCPWYSNAQEDMAFGGSLDLDEVTGFIATRSYVKSVSKVSVLILQHNNKIYTITDSAQGASDRKKLYSSQPWCVLIPMKQHQINMNTEEQNLTPEKAAIMNMRLGREFVVAGKTENTLPEDAPDDATGLRGYVEFDIPL